MSLGRNVLMAFAVSGVAVAATLGFLAKQTKKRQQRAQRLAELQRWENEGGNVYQVSGVRVRPIGRRR